MSKRTIHGIDLTAPGGIEALFAFRRAQFGDATMSVAPGEAPPSGETPPPAGGETSPPPPAGNEPPKAAEWDGKVESLPAGVQKLITDLRKDAGDERVAKKTLDAIQAALNPDAKAGEKPDAEKLTKALAERDADAKQAKTELAVYKLAGKAGADADALIDSRGFLAKLADIDPTNATAITKAITDAVKENPKLKVVLAAGTSGANFGGSGESTNNANKARPGQARIAAAYASK